MNATPHSNAPGSPDAPGDASPVPNTTQSASGQGGDDTPAPKQESFIAFLLKLALIVVFFRSFIFSPFNIPSESMLPTLMNGDYLLAAKWPYGYTKHSLPFSAPVIPGRIMASPPEPGDIVIFKHPVDGVDYIKRAIALPGDTVEMRDGQLVLNGTPIKRERIEDLIIPLSPNTECHVFGTPAQTADGAPACQYLRYRETLPNGAVYDTLDFGPGPADNFGPVIVPEGSVFVMGDNRDNSQDSRFDAVPGGGVGMVPENLLIGRATVLMWSTDGSAEWIKPWTWFSAARGSRIGNGL